MRPLTARAAAEMLRILEAPIPRGERLSVQLRVSQLDAGRATTQLVISDAQGVRDIKEQCLALLPETPVEEPRYQAFVEGVARALTRCDLDASMPLDVLVVELLRVPSLVTAEGFAEAILDPDRQAQLLAPIHFPLVDPTCGHALWVLENDDDFEAHEAAVAALIGHRTGEWVPFALRTLEHWLEVMAPMGGVSRVTDDDRNADVVLARRLEPSLRKFADSELLRRIDALAVMGLFDPEHESAQVSFMYET